MLTILVVSNTYKIGKDDKYQEVTFNPWCAGKLLERGIDIKPMTFFNLDVSIHEFGGTVWHDNDGYKSWVTYVYDTGRKLG